MHKPPTAFEADYLNVDRDLKFIRHSLWRLTIIEIAKLFSSGRNDKFRLSQFLSKLSDHYSMLNINPERIDEWKQVVVWEKDVITKVMLLRNKIYAHSDPIQYQTSEIELYFVDIIRLFNFVSAIIKEINREVFDSDFDLQTEFERGKFDMVEVLAKEYHQKLRLY